MAEVRLDLADEAATVAAGRAIAASLRPGDLVELEGALGAGKTSFARGVLAGLGLPGEAPSPSFPVVITYQPPEVRLPVWHVDLYRIEEAGEIAELGLDDALADGVLLIEWPERLERPLGAEALRIRLVADGGGRRLTCNLGPAWQQRWPLR